MLAISDYRFAYERQPLVRPFHFKGGFFTEKWINVVKLVMGSPERSVVAIGGNAVLWSDAAVFRAWSEDGGNGLMTLLAERAVQMACGASYENPIDAFGAVRTELHAYAKLITGCPNLAPTFTHNAMVALDLALWKAHARVKGTEKFPDLIPADLRGAFDHATASLVRVPLVSYNVPVEEVVALVRQGHRVLKIKLGQAGGTAEMVEKDAARLAEVHRALADGPGPVHYYLDANGRYPDLDSLRHLLERADSIGVLPLILLLEEPFPYESKIDVSDLPVRIAADESLHDVADVNERVHLGYGALALKPAGKTLSLSVLMAEKAAELGIPCFVADSACVPLLVEWNRVFAAHLPPFPGLGAGLLESNGAQNYGNWDSLLGEHPLPTASWLKPTEGGFALPGEFFASSGGIFRTSGHYETLVGNPEA